MRTIINGQKLYQLLLRSGIINSIGKVYFELKGINFPVNSKDGIGGLIQEWLYYWAIKNGIYLRPNSATQEFPDYYLSQDNNSNYLEIKTFNYNTIPSFDIANFESYVNSLLLKPNKIDTCYLIFGYELQDNGILIIKNIWLKKIWELTTSSNKWALKVQDKRGTIYNIRPYNFKGHSRTEPFKNKLEFLKAIQSLLNQYPKIRNNPRYINWFDSYLKIAYSQGVLLQ